MTPSDLSALIAGDSEAAAMFAAGNDSGCAARCVAIAPQVVSPVPVLIGELGLIRIFAEQGNVFGGDAFLASLESIAASQQQAAGTVKRILRSIYPPAEGVDFSDPVLRGQLDAFAAAGLLNQSLVNVIKNAVLVPQVITADDVSATRNHG